MDERISDEFVKLVETVARLRAPEGCPWDRQQTHESLRRYAIEETYEVVEAIDKGEPGKLREELGDLLLQVLLHAQIASEAGEFDIGDVCRVHREKLIRRHPHVFADAEVSGVEDVLTNWEEIKRREPGHRERESVLAGVPESLPALMRAAKLSKKAARTGFDWPNIHSIFDKLSEETRELREAVDSEDKGKIKEEIGDLLFVIVNISRFAGIDPEEALRDMLAKFTFRFRKIEEYAREAGRDIHDMTLDEMDRVWDEAK